MAKKHQRARGTCRGAHCGKEFLWGKTQYGRPIPLEIEEVTVVPTDEHGGNTTIIRADGHRVVGRLVTDPTNEPPESMLVKGRVPHHIVCPDAASFRKAG